MVAQLVARVLLGTETDLSHRVEEANQFTKRKELENQGDRLITNHESKICN